MKILVPTDGSAASLRALKHAIGRANAYPGVFILLINVQNLSTLGLHEGGGVMSPSWIEQEEERASLEVLKEAQGICKAAGVAYAVRTERGGIAGTIDRVARADHIDEIIMGTRGLGGVRGLLVGSIATQVLHLVDVPVTFVK